MEEIDWSKAPAGAEWYCNGNWYRRTSSHWQEHTHSGWLATAYISPENFSWWAYAVPRPTWNGEGLPPVGTVCEVAHPDWRLCEVFAHKINPKRNIDVLFSYERDDGAKDWNWYSEANRFRPIRTAEQIAAEEREKAVQQMVEDTDYDAIIFRRLLGALYDAGYRKVSN